MVRLKDAKDRRRVHVRLTGAGVRMREASSVLDPGRVEALVGRLGDDDRARAIEGLALLARAAQEQMHADQDGRKGTADGLAADGRKTKDAER